MNRLFLSAVMVATVTGATFAADLSTYEPAPIVEPAPVAYNWSGFYGGLQAGWGSSEFDINDGLGLDESIDMDGGFAGGVVGAQWQWNRVLFGVEGDLNWSGVEGEETGPGFDNLDGKIDWFGSLNAKLGLPIDRTLLYAIGGVAFASAETGQRLAGGSSYDDQTFTGWTVGAGVDYAVTDNIIAGLQYKYYDFGDADFDLEGGFTNREGDLEMHTVSARLTYKFNPF